MLLFQPVEILVEAVARGVGDMYIHIGVVLQLAKKVNGSGMEARTCDICLSRTAYSRIAHSHLHNTAVAENEHNILLSHAHSAAVFCG